MNPKLLYQWMSVIQTQFYNLSKWQAVGLALYSYGVVLAGHCQGSKVAESLGFFARIPTLERRFRRWLSNRRIDMEACFQVWTFWVWKSLDAPRAVLLVDETKIADRIGVMMVSLAYENRAIPLVWCCYRANSVLDYPQQGQVLMVWGLLARVAEALPQDSRPVVQMDRGLGHSSAMLKALMTLPITFQVRVKQNATFTSRRGHKCLLQDLVKPGEQVTCHGYLFRYRKKVKVTVHLIWDVSQTEPWCLVTNDTQIWGAVYALRVWQEESFRDLKSGGWQWQCTFVTSPDHAQRLLLVLTVAYAWMLTQGTFVLNGDDTIQREVCDGKHNKYSVFRSGLRWFKRMIYHHTEKIYVGLCFIPRFKP
jgi:hypothetical protein